MYIKNNSWRLIYFKIGLIAFVAIVFIYLFNIEIVKGADFSQLSNNNRVNTEIVEAPRGIIFDEKNRPLVVNKDSYNVVIDVGNFNEKSSKLIFSKLSNILSMKYDDIDNIVKKEKNKSNNKLLLKANISKDQMIQIQSDPLFDQNAVRIENIVIRNYPYKDLLTPILGYVGLVSDDDIKNNSNYNKLDQNGKTGIEYYYDEKLRGTNGEEIVQRDNLGNTKNIFEEKVPVSGENIILSINLDIQSKLNELLADGINRSGAKGGAAILENVNDGSIIALSSLPTYDDNIFIGGISEADYEKLNNDGNFPFLNRAIASPQPPGSVMKTITASAALQEKAIDENTIFDSEGVFNYGGIDFQDYERIKRGLLNVVGGIKWSSNIFFYQTILKLGINKFNKYEKSFGVGSLTGIDLPSEEKGQISSPEVKQSLTNEVWTGGDSLNASIGQGYTLVTPIQVVNWISSIANGGTLYKPHIASAFQDNITGAISKNPDTILNKGFVDSKNLDIVKEGMYDAVNENGIDSSAKPDSVQIAAKTGTAEFGTERDINGNYKYQHAWTASFAPYVNPQVSLVVFLYGGGLSSNSSYVTKNFYNWYYGTYLKNN